jgi:hypothetical protein
MERGAPRRSMTPRGPGSARSPGAAPEPGPAVFDLVAGQARRLPHRAGRRCGDQPGDAAPHPARRRHHLAGHQDLGSQQRPRLPAELAVLCDLLGRHQVVLDGEIVALDDAGRPSFAALASRVTTPRPMPALWRRVPVQLFVFDLLWLDDRATTELPTSNAARCSTPSTFPASTARSPFPVPGPAPAISCSRSPRPTGWKASSPNDSPPNTRPAGPAVGSKPSCAAPSTSSSAAGVPAAAAAPTSPAACSSAPTTPTERCATSAASAADSATVNSSLCAPRCRRSPSRPARSPANSPGHSPVSPAG